MTKKRFKPSWDRGNGWLETKAEWQDIDRRVDKSVTTAELKEMWCPASTSVISVEVPEVPGLSFDLEVGLKEYNPGTGQKRKPTRFGVVLRHDGKVHYLPFIPLASATPETIHAGAWHEKKSWSAAVRTLLNDVIPSYVEKGEALSLWGLAPKQEIGQV